MLDLTRGCPADVFPSAQQLAGHADLLSRLRLVFQRTEYITTPFGSQPRNFSVILIWQFSVPRNALCWTYAITIGTIGNPNYKISYTGANLRVTARPITVTADARSRYYGSANPVLTYTVGGMGLANGDALSGALATSAGVADAVGSYAIDRGTLSASKNYTLTYLGGNLSVTARPITIIANAQRRLAQQPNPALTYQIGDLGLVNGDTLTGAPDTRATMDSGPGYYAITRGNLDASTNYAVSFEDGILFIDPSAIATEFLASAIVRDDFGGPKLDVNDDNELLLTEPVD